STFFFSLTTFYHVLWSHIITHTYIPIHVTHPPFSVSTFHSLRPRLVQVWNWKGKGKGKKKKKKRKGKKKTNVCLHMKKKNNIVFLCLVLYGNEKENGKKLPSYPLYNI